MRVAALIIGILASTVLFAPPSQPVAAGPGQVAVAGRVNRADGGLPTRAVVRFQHSDCPSCAGYAARTDPAGGYHLTLPRGRYRASCAVTGVWERCRPLAVSPDVTLDEPSNRVTFEIEISGGTRPPSRPWPAQALPPWIVTPQVRW